MDEIMPLPGALSILGDMGRSGRSSWGVAGGAELEVLVFQDSQNLYHRDVNKPPPL